MEVESSSSGDMKMQKNYADEVSQVLPKAEKLAQSGKLQDAVDMLLLIEKQTRNAADMISNGKVLVEIVKLCFLGKDFKLLQEMLVSLSKKHGLIKQAVTKMVQEAYSYVSQVADKKQKVEFINTLLEITEGKIYVEIERARLTRTLATIKEQEGNVNEAADILQALQVETFGSMEKREKTDFILEQMRLNLARKDYVRTQIISKKINVKYFEDEQTEDLKLRYYELMIQWALHDQQYLSITEFYRHVYNSKSIQAEEPKWRDVLQYVVIFIILAPFNNEQNDLMHKIALDKKLDQLPLYKQLLKSFCTPELIVWDRIVQMYGNDLKQLFVFRSSGAGSSDDGEKRWNDLRSRVIEHNVRVIAKYYTRISMQRLVELLNLQADEAELFLCKLVTDGVIYARIDRIQGVAIFQKPRQPNDVVSEWSTQVGQLLDLVSNTSHLISKEEVVRTITKSVV
ncbi:hypothetical protein MP228_009225 [Amoeboaphelidium protococcarum]|nr:hypothetical protein MP228_009225 [Amoeboaphelidium protococcarum]